MVRFVSCSSLEVPLGEGSCSGVGCPRSELSVAQGVWRPRFRLDLHGWHCLRSSQGWCPLVAACLAQGWRCCAFDPVPLPSNSNMPPTVCSQFFSSTADEPYFSAFSGLP